MFIRDAKIRIKLISSGAKGGTRDMPPGSKFFKFHAVFGNHMLSPPQSWCPHLREIPDPPLLIPPFSKDIL